MKAAIIHTKTVTKEQELHELLRCAEVPDKIREEWAVKTIKRAVARVRLKAVPLAWLEWADKWESGEDRTEETAGAAFKVKWSQNAPVPSQQTALYATRAAYAFSSNKFYNSKFRYVSAYCRVCANWSVAWVNNNNVSRRIKDAEITKQLDDLVSRPPLLLCRL